MRSATLGQSISAVEVTNVSSRFLAASRRRGAVRPLRGIPMVSRRTDRQTDQRRMVIATSSLVAGTGH